MTSPALDLSFPTDGGLGDLISAELHDLSVTAVHETESGGRAIWRVFFASPQARDAALIALDRRFAVSGLGIVEVDVPDEDWAARSQADLRHVRIGRIVVSPPWDVPVDLEPREILVVIRPSMGFGTGHHATTRLCLRLMQRIDCRERSVLDVGTGSGVLAIAAARLGAAAVTGIDVDPDALASAEENLHVNRPATVRFVRADVGDLRERADIVFANLTGAALRTLAPRLLASTAAGGWLVLSGFQDHEAGEVLAAFGSAAECEARESEDGWVAALLHKRSRQARSPWALDVGRWAMS